MGTPVNDLKWSDEYNDWIVTTEDHENAVEDIASFYQSKRAKLKKQVTHWIGKFMICKAENNALRNKLLKAKCLIAMYEHCGYGEYVPKAKKIIQEIDATKETVKC